LLDTKVTPAGPNGGAPFTGDYPGTHPHTSTDGTIKRVAIDVNGDPLPPR
jgi:hypothetical protein